MLKEHTTPLKNSALQGKSMVCSFATCLALLRFYNPLSIWVELVEVLHVGIIIKAAFPLEKKKKKKQKRGYLATSVKKKIKNKKIFSKLLVYSI